MLRSGVIEPAAVRRPSDADDGRRLLALQCLYDIGYLLLLVVAAPFFIVKLITSPKVRAGLVERFGFVPRRTGPGRCVWIHGVSVGETLAAGTLVRHLERDLPDWEIWISTTTRTGQAVARAHYPTHSVFYFPLDFSFATRRVLDRVRPDAVILMELEIWPNFLLSTWIRRVPVLLANGRISARSHRNYRFLQRIIPEPLDRIAYYCVQTEEYAARFRDLGVSDDRIFVTGTMKFDNVETHCDDALAARLRASLGLAPQDRVLVAGSTHDGEDGSLLDVHRRRAESDPQARLVLVPRHPERLADVEALVRGRGLPVVRKTALDAATRDGGVPPRPDEAVILVDTMGELATLYLVADVVFVGGSLVPWGGQNMIEPAGRGRPVLYGPHVENFQEAAEVLEAAGGAIRVADAAGLAREVDRLFANPGDAAAMGERARRAVLEHRGATERMRSVVLDVLQGRRP